MASKIYVSTKRNNLWIEDRIVFMKLILKNGKVKGNMFDIHIIYPLPLILNKKGRKSLSKQNKEEIVKIKTLKFATFGVKNYS